MNSPMSRGDIFEEIILALELLNLLDDGEEARLGQELCRHVRQHSLSRVVVEFYLAALD